MVLFPALYRRQAALFFGLSPRSRLKRALLRRALVSGWAAWLEVWDSWEVEPAYVIDLGDRVLALGIAHARAGGVKLKEEFAQTVTLRDGLISHDGPSGLIRWDDALRNAGLDPEAITLPRHKRGQAANNAG
jgi:hypothetical protein